MRQLIMLSLAVFVCVKAEAAGVVSWKGKVEIKKGDAKEWRLISETDVIPLVNGDELRTSRASMAELEMDDGSKVKIAPASYFKMNSDGASGVSLGLFFGKVRSMVKKFGRKFEVRTPAAVCAVRGTDFTVSADEEGSTRIEVYEGSVLAGDSLGKTSLVREGQFIEVPVSGGMRAPAVNNDPPADMNSASMDPQAETVQEIYSEISKEDVIARAQSEIQSAEYQNRKTAIDAFGNRVRMEEYIIRPADNQFKYVVINNRDDRFDFGKILFTFNAALPDDLSDATGGMISYAGAVDPQWYLTAMNSVMSNTSDKVTEDASGGRMISNGSAADPYRQLVFADYSFYAAGPDEANDNGGLGKWIWTKTDYNVATGVSADLAYLGQPSVPTIDASNPSGGDVFHTYTKNTFADADNTWIAAQDFVLFDDGKVLKESDFGTELNRGETVDSITDRLNFQRVYTSSLFGDRSINVEFSAKLLKDAGLLRF